VRMEDYLRGVVPLEMGSGASVPWSALEAQAIAARCYALFCLDRHEDEYRCDLLAGPEDQVYGGIAAETPEANQAVSNTRGIVAVSGGRPIRANYCSTCGGRTEANHRVWEAQAPLPYLRSIRDDSFGGCLCADSPYHRWEERWGCEELNASVLKHLPTEVPEARGVRLGRVRDLQVVERSPSGRAAVLRVVTEGGSFEVRGDRIRWVVRRADGGPLRSTYFDRFRRIGGKDCTIGLKGAGYGHGVGMCQFGAREMGRQGSSAAEILGHYYHGIALVRWW
jgi:stage II sporulation protein D